MDNAKNLTMDATEVYRKTWTTILDGKPQTPKTLPEVLWELPEDYNLKVGAIDGSTFFYLGTVSDLRGKMESRSEELMQMTIQARDKATKRTEASRRTYQKLALQLAQRMEEAGLTNEEQTTWRTSLKNQRRLINQLESLATAARKAALEFKPLSRRVVLEAYMATHEIDPQTIIVIVTGCEIGKYWVREEAPTTPIICINSTVKRGARSDEDNEEPAPIEAATEVAEDLQRTEDTDRRPSEPETAPTRQRKQRTKIQALDVGVKRGYLKVVRPAVREEVSPKEWEKDSKYPILICQCMICGKQVPVRQNILMTGARKSCGCLHNTTRGQVMDMFRTSMQKESGQIESVRDKDLAEREAWG